MRKSRESTERHLHAAHEGSTQALGVILESCRQYLMWIARRSIDPTCQAKAGASDLVQETLLEAHRDFQQFTGTTEEELLAWLRRLLLNNVANFVRFHRDTAKRSVRHEVSLGTLEAKSGPNANLPGGSAPPPEQVMINEEFQLLREAVNRLPDEHRLIIQLWHFEERSFESIATQLKCSPNTVRNRWLKALENLQVSLVALA